ncbi:DNA-directed RNA polymerase I subunit RPA34 [Streptomyces sp. LN549]|uniref:DNA-directed RNA polymerase I subunit RPA34 n=1 Tax=Streptomyces sp. LN549 TaxID=3112979 RepID=UPI00371E246E
MIRPADLCGNGYPIGGTGQVKGDKTRYTKNASTGIRWQLGPYINKSGKAVTFPGKKTKSKSTPRKKRVPQLSLQRRPQIRNAAKRTAPSAVSRKGHFSDARKNTIESAVGRGISQAYDWTAKHRACMGTVLGYGAIAACTFGTAGVCAVAGGLALDYAFTKFVELLAAFSTGMRSVLSRLEENIMKGHVASLGAAWQFAGDHA